MKQFLIFLLVFAATAVNAQTVTEELSMAFYQNDVPKLIELLEDPRMQGRDWQSGYYRAFAHVHIARVTMEQDGDSALDHLEKAELELEKILSTKENEFEVLILMVSAKGLMVGASSGTRFWKGLQAKDVLEKAEKVAPNHPKVRFEKAIGYIFAPSWFGKDLKKAMALLEKNLSGEFSNPDWTPDVRKRADNHAWLAFIALELKDPPKARFHIRQALKYQPDYKFALNELLEKYKQLTGEQL